MDADKDLIHIKLEPDYEYLEISNITSKQRKQSITRRGRKRKAPIEFCDVDLIDEDINKSLKKENNKEEANKTVSLNDDSDDDWTPLLSKDDNIPKKDKTKPKRDAEVYIPRDPLLCYICNKTYSSKAIYDRHLLIHKIELRRRKLHICPYCSKMFNRHFDLRSHLFIHTGESPFVCDICDKKFRTKRGLDEHSAVHTGSRAHECDECGRGFSVRSSLRNHVDQVHLKKHRDPKVEPATCDICSKECMSKRALRRHRVTHSGEKKHECHLCEKKFSTRQTLKIHLHIHTGERPHSCEICSQSFKQRSALQGHMVTHSDVKPEFECTVCNAKFTRRPTLNRHMAVHTGEKPYVCTVCGKSFSQKGNLVVHMRYHNGGQPHACPICHKQYSHRSKVITHMRNNHDASSKRMTKAQKVM